MLSNKIIPSYFILSFGIGILVCYLYMPKPRVIFKYPNVYNLDQIYNYKNSDKCYKYNIKEVGCE